MVAGWNYWTEPFWTFWTRAWTDWIDLWAWNIELLTYISIVISSKSKVLVGGSILNRTFFEILNRNLNKPTSDMEVMTCVSILICPSSKFFLGTTEPKLFWNFGQELDQTKHTYGLEICNSWHTYISVWIYATSEVLVKGSNYWSELSLKIWLKGLLTLFSPHIL